MPEPFMPIKQVAGNPAELTDRVRFGGERIANRRHGRNVAMLAPPFDLEALEALEDRLDALDALADYRANGGISFHDLEDDLGLCPTGS